MIHLKLFFFAIIDIFHSPACFWVRTKPKWWWLTPLLSQALNSPCLSSLAGLCLFPQVQWKSPEDPHSLCCAWSQTQPSTRSSNHRGSWFLALASCLVCEDVVNLPLIVSALISNYFVVDVNIVAAFRFQFSEKQMGMTQSQHIIFSTNTKVTYTPNLITWRK